VEKYVLRRQLPACFSGLVAACALDATPGGVRKYVGLDVLRTSPGSRYRHMLRTAVAIRYTERDSGQDD